MLLISSLIDRLCKKNSWKYIFRGILFLSRFKKWGFSHVLDVWTLHIVLKWNNIGLTRSSVQLQCLLFVNCCEIRRDFKKRKGLHKYSKPEKVIKLSEYFLHKDKLSPNRYQKQGYSDYKLHGRLYVEFLQYISVIYLKWGAALVSRIPLR